jgi:hypothetical protein
MAKVADSVLNAGLEEIRTAERVVVCSSEPATYAAVAGVTLVANASPSHGAVEDYAGGRQFTTAAATGLTATATGTGTHYAYVDDSSTELLCTQTLDSSVSITSGDTYNIAAITVQAPDPA